MPPNVHRASFVPPPIGIAHVEVDKEWRIGVPKELRRSFGDRKPLFSVLYGLAGPGYATAQAADDWPPYGERSEVERILNELESINPAELPSDHLEIVQHFARTVACRYIDGRMGAKWQLKIPRVVRAWLGWKAEQRPGGKRPAGKPQRPLAIVVGNIGSLEIWSEETFKDASIEQIAGFNSLREKAAAAVAHARGLRSKHPGF